MQGYFMAQTFKQYLESKKIDLLNTKDSDYDTKTLKTGQSVEFEHTDDPKAAAKIAKQHIAEFPKITKHGKISSDYYAALFKMETELRKQHREKLRDVIDNVVSENTLAGGDGSVFGANAGTGAVHNGGFSGDNYAKGDARNIFGPCFPNPKRKKRGRKQRYKKQRHGFPLLIRRTLASK